MRLPRTLALAFLLGTGGCSALGLGGDSAPPLPVVQASSMTPVVFTVPTGKLALAPVVVDLPHKKGLGSYTRNVGCWVPVRDIVDRDFPASSVFTESTRKALEAAKLTVLPGEPATVADAHGADYLLTAKIDKAHADLCINNLFNEGPADIDALVTVKWQLWSVRDGRVVFETVLVGGGSAQDAGQRVDAGVREAMRAATNALLQTVTAQQYLTFGKLASPIAPPSTATAFTPSGGSAPLPVPVGQAAAPIAVPARPAPVIGALLVQVHAPKTNGSLDANAARLAVLGLGTASAGSSIGDGYILTTAQAVGDAITVSANLPNGKPADGRVLRRDAEADIAVIKLDSAVPGALALQPRRPAVGDRVYGIGPTGAVLSGTITAKGGVGAQDRVKLDGANPGGPVLDASGNLLGILQAGGAYLPVGAAFRALNMGAQLSDE